MPLPKYAYQILNYTYEVWDHRPNIPNLFTVTQVHGTSVIDTSTGDHSSNADAIISTDNTPIAIKTADCIPILFVSDKGAAIVHAGWKGLRDNIIENKEIVALRPQRIFIGPHIRAENYEVSLDFLKYFPNSHNFKEIEGRIYFDMTTEIIGQLKSIYPKSTIDDCELNTFTDERFYSYRNGDKEKRNWNILRKL